MRRLSGFSLMEMMIVLLIVSIVAAATAPMINKKMMLAQQAPGDCKWEDVANGIAYNQEGQTNTVNIGTNERPDIISSLNIKSNNANPTQITLQDNANNTARLFFNNGTFGFTNGILSGNNSIAIGSSNMRSPDSIIIGNGGSVSKVGTQMDSSVKNFTVIGHGSTASGNDSIVVGNGAHSNYWNQVVIGNGAKAFCYGSVAIGKEAKAGKLKQEGTWNGIAIGYQASSEGDGTIAIGCQATASSTDSIAIGDSSTEATIGGLAISSGAKALTTNSIAIGKDAIAKEGALYSIAIGCNASVAEDAKESTAIGYNAKADKPKQIVLGSPDSTVYIPGNLIVGKMTYLGVGEPSYPYPPTSLMGGTKKFGPTALVLKWSADNELHPISTTSGADNLSKAEMTVSSPLSDRRLKNVGKAFIGGLAELKKLDLFHYTYKKDKSNTPHVGVMAQDLQKVFPDAVTKGDDGFLRIRMEDMFYALINAVKELAGMFDKQDEKIVQLEKENMQLQKTVADLEKQNKDILKRLEKLEKQK